MNPADKEELVGSDGKASVYNARDLGSILWRRKWQPTPVLLPRKSHGRRSLVGYNPRGHKESDTTERLHFHFQAKKGKMREKGNISL